MSSDNHEGANYRCPSCTGEFPTPVDGGCPWCGQQLGEYHPLDQVMNTPQRTGEHAVTKVEKKDDAEESNGVVAKIGGLFR